MALMNSFYGGRRGASFIIVKNYLDILTMTTDFANGNDFTQVHFDEYVIINNPNKNHPDNGKIFRRGYDYNSSRLISGYVATNSSGTGGWEERNIEAHGAEYIGTIIGPAGKAPLLTITSYADAEARQAEDNFETRQSSGVYSPNGINPGLIPGKEGNTFHDSIEWYCTSVRNDDYGDDTEAYIGFKFPYLVTQMETSWVEPYDANGNKYNANTIFPISRASDDDGSHPYYNKWHLNIPKGIKGDVLRNLKVTTFNDFHDHAIDSNEKTALCRFIKDSETHEWVSQQLYGGDEINYDFFRQQYGYDGEETISALSSFLDGDGNDENQKQILVYEAINYDNKQEGQKIYYYLGDFNQINNVNLENGILTIDFTNDATKQFEMKSIKSIKLGLNSEQEEENSLLEGQLEITYTTNAKQVFQIPWVNGIDYISNDESGLIDLYYTTAGSDEPNFIMRGLKNIENIISLPNGGIKIIYQGGYEQDFPLKTVANIEAKRKYNLPKYKRDTSGKVIYYNYTDDNNIEEGTEVESEAKTIRYTKNQSLDGKPVPLINNQTHEQQTEEVTGIIVTYINGQQELVTDKNNIFNFLEKFEYNEQDGKFTIQQFKDGVEKNLYINYVNSILWDDVNNKLKYGITGNPNASSQINQEIDIPFIQQLDVTDNLDFFVRFSNAWHNGNRRNLVGQEPSWNNIDSVTESAHPRSNANNEDSWYYLGNLFKANVFENIKLFEVGLNWNYGNLKTEVDKLSDTDENIVLKERVDNITEYTDSANDIILEAFNALYPQGIGEQGPSGGLIAYGEDEEIKSLYGFSPVMKDENDNIIIQGGWFFLGTSASGKELIQVGESASTLATGGYLFKTVSDIYQITIEDNINIILSNPMKSIKAGASYTSVINPISQGSLQVIMSGTDITNSCYDSTVRTINIPSVTGDISFRINTG